MSKEEKNDTIVETRHALSLPALRFPEFQDAGEWEVIEFSRYIKLYRGSSPRPIQDFLSKDDSGVNWIKIGDTKNACNSIINQVEEKITLKGAEKSRKVEKGELILANSMSYGKTYELAIEGYIYDGWFVLREYEDHFHKPFLLQLLNSDYMQTQYQRLSAGGIVQNISSEIVYNTMLFHTSLPEQRKIADCLSSLDEWITAESEKLEALKAHKKGLMQQLFPAQGETVPRLRFPEFQDSEEWEEKTLGEVAPLQRGFDLPINSIVVGDYPVVFSNGILKYHNEFKVKAPGVVTGRSGTIGKVTYVSKDFWPHNTSLWVTDFCGNDPLFVFYLFVFIGLEQFGTGSGVPTLNRNDVHKHTILIPTLPEQRKIADCLSSLDELITAQGEKVTLLKAHKKGLMQRLFPVG